MRSFRVGFRLQMALIAVAATVAGFLGAQSALAAEFGVEEFLAGTCKVSTCNKSSTLPELFTQAADASQLWDHRFSFQ